VKTCSRHGTRPTTFHLYQGGILHTPPSILFPMHSIYQYKNRMIMQQHQSTALEHIDNGTKTMTARTPRHTAPRPREQPCSPQNHKTMHEPVSLFTLRCGLVYHPGPPACIELASNNNHQRMHSAQLRAKRKHQRRSFASQTIQKPPSSFFFRYLPIPPPFDITGLPPLPGVAPLKLLTMAFGFGVPGPVPLLSGLGPIPGDPNPNTIPACPACCWCCCCC